MGWVRERIESEVTIAKSIMPLWNTLRDSIGTTVTEYNALTIGSEVNRLDCQARAVPCIRVQKSGAFIEIFLSESDGKVKSAVGATCADREICGYRVNGNRTGLEFFEGDNILSADDVAQRALEDFLFVPPPTIRS
jgi:hypothetical protein